MKKMFLSLLFLIWAVLFTGCFTNIWNQTDQIYLSAFWTEPFWNIEISGNVAKFFEMNMLDYENRIQIPVSIVLKWENYEFSWEKIYWIFEKKDCIDWWKWDTHDYTVSITYEWNMLLFWCWDDYQRNLEDSDLQEWNIDITWIEWWIEDCESTSPYRLENPEGITNISYSWYDKQNIWNSYKILWNLTYEQNWEFIFENVFCTFTTNDKWWENDYYGTLKLEQYPREKECWYMLENYKEIETMEWHPETTISIWCFPEDYWNDLATWYLYTTKYPDLWLAITTPEWAWDYYEWIFRSKAQKPIFEQKWNRISYMVNWQEDEYIQVYEKSESESLEEIITKKHLNDGCVINVRNYYDQKMISANYPWTIIYDIRDVSWAMPGKCIPNDENKTWKDDHRLVRYFESSDKTKYYKVVFTDWCAPWPCSIFWKIEIQ